MSSKRELIIVCGGGFAREVLWLSRECLQEWAVIGFLDDTESLQGRDICEVPVLGKIDDWLKFSDTSFIVALGSPRGRKTIVDRMESRGKVKFATLVHPSVQRSKYVQFGEGTIVTASCILTTQVIVGRHCVINLACTIGHDVSIGDFCTLAPQAIVSGNVRLADGVEIGTGATLIEKLSVETGSFVGAGAVVSKDLPANGLFVGSPARLVKSLTPFSEPFAKEQQ